MNYKDGSKFNATLLDGEGNPLANQTVRFNVMVYFTIELVMKMD